jgi:hypothetical protein
MTNGTVSTITLDLTNSTVYFGGNFSNVMNTLSLYIAGVTNPLDESLPVQLVSFNALVVKDKVELNWKTATELNNYGFNVERKPETGEWTDIGFVKGSDKSNSPRNYSFVDNSASYGNYSYRLKQLDKDGIYQYSSVVNANAGQIPKDFVLNQNYPNPFNPSTRIQFGVNINTHASLVVYNIIGREVITLFNDEVIAGQIYDVIFNGNNLLIGIYYYTLRAGNYTETKKLLLLK